MMFQDIEIQEMYEALVKLVQEAKQEIAEGKYTEYTLEELLTYLEG